MASAGTVTVDFVAKIANLETNLTKAVNSVDNATKKMSASLKQFAAIAVTAFSLEKLKSGAQEWLDYADNMGKMSQRVAISTETLSGWSNVANKAGVDTDTFAKSLATLEKQQDAAKNGNQDAINAFGRIGLKLKDIQNLHGDQLFLKTADAMAQYRDGGAKLATAQQLMGKTGAQMIPAINQGAKAFEEGAEQAKKFGTAVDDATADMAGRFNDTMADLKQATSGLWSQLMTQLLPTFQEIGDGLSSYVNSEDWQSLKKVVGDSAQYMVWVFEDAYSAVKTAMNLLMGSMIRAWNRLEFAWDDFVALFSDGWETAVNNVKKKWQELIQSIVNGMNKLPAVMAEKMGAGSLQAYADSLTVQDDMDAKHKAAALKRQQDFEAKQQATRDTFDRAAEAEQIKMEFRQASRVKASEQKKVAQMPRASDLTQNKDMGVVPDAAKIKAAADAMKSLNDQVTDLYAKNLETGNKVQDDQAAAVRKLAAAGADAIAKGASVVEVQKKIKEGIEQITLAAKKQQEAQDQVFAAWKEQQEQKLKNDRDDYALKVASVGMSDKEIQQAQEISAAHREAAATADEWSKALAKREISPEQYQQYLAGIKDIEDKRVALIKEGNKQIAESEQDMFAGASAAWKNYVDQANDVAGSMKKAMGDALSGLTDQLTDFLTTGKASWKEYATSVLKELARIAVAKSIASAGQYFGLTTNAKGGVFSSPGISALSGGVYNQPTRFFAMGGNVLGEAGPEGVLPLKKNSAGQLGVIAQQSNAQSVVVDVDVNVYQNGTGNATATSDNDQARALGQMVGAKVKESISQEMRPGGMLWRASHA